jgi:type I restriction enzyme R subunit
MSTIGQPERATQNRVIALFRDELGYRYLSDWTDRPDNSNIEESLLTAYLTKSGYSPVQISKALYELRTEAGNPNRSFYDNNKKVYSLLRYGGGGVVSGATQASSPIIDRKMGTDNWRESEKVIRATDEDQMGQLQSSHQRHPAQHRTCEETARMPRIHRCS